MNAKHSPGPWVRGARVPESHAMRILSRDGMLVAEARGAGGPWAQVVANANLIYAAPDLLEALEDAMRLMARSGAFIMDGEAIKRLGAAIAKAKP